jgi:prepilin-type N-terminal cleavage/methylation domain-containing protein
MNTRARQWGFTLMEMVVTLAIIGFLAAILTPLVNKYIDDARSTRAAQEAQTIATGILNFNKDTGKWPIFQSGVNITTSSTIYTTLVSPGNPPTCTLANIGCASWASATSASLSTELEFNTPAFTTSGKFAWRGPYITGTGADPWGNTYIVNASNLGFGVNNAALVLSAGPNGQIETNFTQSIGSGSSAITVGGDDLIARIR